MTLLAQVRAGSGLAARRIALTFALSVIGLAIGFGCVLLPVGIPFGIVALAGLLLLWVMPDLRAVPERLTRMMYYPFVVSVLCIPTYFALVFPGVPWISIRRSILFAFIGPALITIAGSSRYRSKIMDTLRSSKPLLFCLTGLFSMIAISTVLSSKPGAAINATTNIAMLWLIPLVATLMLARDEQLISTIMKLFIACVFFDFCIGLIEFKLQRPFLFYILPPSMRAEVIKGNSYYIKLITGQGLRNGFYRAASIYNISLSWGEMAAMMLPMGAYFLAHGTTQWKQVCGWVGLFAAMGSLFLAGSRGGYVGGLVAIIAFFVLWAIRRNRTHPHDLRGGIAIFLSVMVGLATVLCVLFVARINHTVLGTGEAQASTEARYAEWALAKPKVLASPLWGYGPGTSGDVVGYYVPGSDVPTVDSYIITSLVEWGVPGCLFFFGTLGLAIFLSFRIYLLESSKTSAIGASLGCSLLAFIICRVSLSQQENMTPMFIIVAFVVILNHRIVRMRSARPRDRGSASRQSHSPKPERLSA